MNTPEREELPELPEPDHMDPLYGRVFSSMQMRAYGRLCRAGREDATDFARHVVADWNRIMRLGALGWNGEYSAGFRDAIERFQRHLVDEAVRYAVAIRRLSPQAGGSDE